MSSGMFCVFEGIDGSGKSTLLSLLQGALPGPNHPEISHRFTDVQFLREPTDFETGREIRKRLAAPSGTDRNEWIDLFLRDRADNVARNIRPLLASGALILQDRYYYSTAAYQGDESKPPHPVEIVDMNLERGFPRPDLVFFLALPAETAVHRISGREAREIFEEEGILRAIDSRFRAVLPPDTVYLDAHDTPETLADRVLTSIRKAAGC
ncbi:MAG: dTMP kinase [Spirochaetia bacterium]|nr:dTMP kinase [Spirochaetia bacterium]